VTADSDDLTLLRNITKLTCLKQTGRIKTEKLVQNLLELSDDKLTINL